MEPTQEKKEQSFPVTENKHATKFEAFVKWPTIGLILGFFLLLFLFQPLISILSNFSGITSLINGNNGLLFVLFIILIFLIGGFLIGLTIGIAKYRGKIINFPYKQNTIVSAKIDMGGYWSAVKARVKLRKPLFTYPLVGLAVGIVVGIISVSMMKCDEMECFILPIIAGYITGGVIILAFIIGIIKYIKKVKQLSPEQLPTKKYDNISIIILSILSICFGYSAIFNLSSPFFLSFDIASIGITLITIFFSYFFWPLSFIVLLTIIFVQNLKKGLAILITLFIFTSLLHSATWLSASNTIGDSNNCHDSDGGKNYSIKGTATGLIGDTTHTLTDKCANYIGIEKGGYVTEYYCNNDQLRNDDYYCPNGCRDGTCIATSSSSI